MSRELRDHQLTVRIPRRIREAIGERAIAERRSVADVVNNILVEIFPAVPKARRRGKRT